MATLLVDSIAIPRRHPRAISMSATLPKQPVELASARLTFEKLGIDFLLDAKVVEAIIAEPCRNLIDLRHLFCKEDEVGAWVDEIGGLIEKRTQVAEGVDLHGYGICRFR